LTEKLIEIKTEMNFKTEISLLLTYAASAGEGVVWWLQRGIVDVLGAPVSAECFRSGAGRRRPDMRSLLLLSTTTPSAATTKLLSTTGLRRRRPLRMRVLSVHFRFVRV